MLKKSLPALLLALCAALDAQAAKRALLIGINDYSASRLGTPRVPPPPDRDWRDLNGAVTDVETLQQMLVLLYGFEQQNLVTLTDQQATREAILRSLDELVSRASKGDVLLFYYAGHGSQVRNSLSDEPDRMDESIVPADSRHGTRDIRDKELRLRFNAIVDKGARLTVILDNCHSGSGARGLPTGARPRAVKPDLRDLADRTRTPPAPTDRGALVLSATQDFDQAWESRDEQGKLHGAFSWALIRAMRDSSADESASETFLRARARLRAETPFQEPVMEGTPEARLTPLFGARSDRRGDRTVVSVEKVQSDGTVLLQGGWANGLSIGTELRVVSDRNISARLRVTEMTGLARCRARIEPGRSLPQAVKSGALLEVVGWAAPPGRPLRVWTPRVSGSAAAIAALARRLLDESSRRGVRWVTDPLEVTPTHLLRRGRSEWELLGSSGAVEPLGPDASDAIAAIARVPRGASLFVQFPAPAAMIDGIAVGPGTDREGVDPTERAEDADYILLARYSSRRLQYAWMRPGTKSTDRRRTGLPLRTDWIIEDGRDGTLRDSVAKLRDAVLRLRRIHAWNLLESPPDERSPYRLFLRRTRNGEIAKDVLIGDERYDVVLRSFGASPPRARQRYTYVFVIDSWGTGTLLFPDKGSVENRLPLSLPAPREIRLGDESAFTIAPPYGIDTFFLLTTDEALPDPWVLEWDGVRTRAPAQTPLEQLLLLTGSTSRAGLVVTPATWSLEKVVFESVSPRARRNARISPQS
ncbi:MAG TPA: caspase family protein [Thermoanaerobaculia bacterium]|nr:caspase family protein [Thermoanaerobaculia bacterium]